MVRRASGSVSWPGRRSESPPIAWRRELPEARGRPVPVAAAADERDGEPVAAGARHPGQRERGDRDPGAHRPDQRPAPGSPRCTRRSAARPPSSRCRWATGSQWAAQRPGRGARPSPAARGAVRPRGAGADPGRRDRALPVDGRRPRSTGWDGAICGCTSPVRCPGRSPSTRARSGRTCRSTRTRRWTCRSRSRSTPGSRPGWGTADAIRPDGATGDPVHQRRQPELDPVAGRSGEA